MRRHFRAPTALVLCAALAGPASGQEPMAATVTKPPDSPERPTLELSLDDAVKRALENNADIAVARYDPEASAQGVISSLSYYDPFASATLSKSSADNPQTNFFSGGQTVTNKTEVWNFGLNQNLPTGGNVNLSFNNNKADSNNSFNTFNPTYSSNLTASLTQPLLRNFKINSGRAQIRIAKKNREISDVQFRQTITNTVANVKALYYNLIYAIDNLGAARKSLDLAKKLLNENEIRVKVGTMAPLDIVQARSEVASREEGVIVAESALFDAEDSLKQAIFTESKENTWALRVMPKDRPTADPIPVDVEAAIRTAFEKRTDIVVARKGLEQADINLELARNQKLPQLDLVAGYGGSGVGGTQLRDSNGDLLVPPIPGGYGDATSQVFGNDFPTWRVGFNVSYSILNRQGKASAAQARISKDQAQATFRRLLLNAAVEIRTAGRGVETNFKRVASSKAARVLAAERLDAEQKKFEAGMSTNFFVTQAQRDLTVAEVAELRAVLDYRISLTAYERSQETGIGGGGGLASLSTNAASRALSSNAVSGSGSGSSPF
jgi:outer membrane protein